MRRREFIAVLGAAAVGIRVARTAQADDQIRRIGVLFAGNPQTPRVLEATLKQLGWTAGKDIQIEYRNSNGDTDLTRRFARELIWLKPSVILAVTNRSMEALVAEGSTIPTVFAMVSDPVGMHYVDSFSRPGRNVTGFTAFEPSLGGKWVSLLKEIAPNVQHIGLIYNPEPGNNLASFRKSVDEVADSLGIASIETPVGDSSDIERLILELGVKPNSGLIFLPDAFTANRRDRVIALVGRSRLPAIYPLRYFCAAGGLISYGPSLDKILAGAASYVDRILRGANPAELPVQAPTEFELIVNQRSGIQIGLQLPAILLARADEVLE